MKYTRRQCLQTASAALLGNTVVSAQKVASQANNGDAWYTRCYRWAQINTTQRDFLQYDLAWWREQWKRTEVQALMVNALGAEFAQYPTKNPLLQRNLFLPDRDLFGEIVEVAHQDGIAVMARMDNANIGGDAFREAHGDWYTVNRAGTRGNAPCINSPYRSEFMPDVYREILTRYKPEGFMDNSGLGGAICYCRFCTRLYLDTFGKPLPNTPDWHDAAYRHWVRWMQDRYVAIWDLNNRVAMEAGGKDCRYVGLVRKFQANVRNIAGHTPILMMDSQSRNDEGSFRENTDEARYINGLGNWNKIAIQAEAMYHHSHGYFRLASDPPAEARMYMWSGLAGGFQPWYHYLGAYWEDTRGYQTPTPVMLWHKKNEQYLVKRRPVATVAVIRSDENSVFYARDAAASLVQTPYRGMVRAIFPTRIPYIPIQIEDLELYADQLSVLVLPNIGGMSDENCAKVRRFVESGGALIATGVTSLYDADGEPRGDFGLASVFGAHIEGALPERTIAPGTAESYLQLAGGGDSDGPRHAVLQGFEDTSLIAFGGSLTTLKVDSDRTVLCTYVPPGIADSPAAARPDSPGLIVGSFGKGRVAFLPADLDRRSILEPSPDHEKLLGNLLKWAVGDSVPVTVDGPGYIGAYLYQQPNRLVLHILNGTGVDNGELITDEYFPVGPLKIKVKIPSGKKPANVAFKVSGRTVPARVSGSSVEFDIPRLVDHEMVVIE